METKTRASKDDYRSYARSRLRGGFRQMNSWKLVQNHLIAKRTLDLGCSDGLYLKELTADSVGIEQISALAEAGQADGLTIINKDLCDGILAIQDCSFEAVLFSHVMEHLENPIWMLEQIHRVLEPKGTLVLGLPIENCAVRQILRMDYFDGTHLYAFTVRNATKLLQRAGFRETHLYYHLPMIRGRLGHNIHRLWNAVPFPAKEWLSMAYWLVAVKE